MSADHLQLVETVGRHEDEMRRWAAKLAPKKPIPGADCCEYGVCTGNYGFPVRQTPADGMCEASGVQCVTPWSCAPVCRLITADGGQQVSDGLPIQMFEPPRWYQRPPSLIVFVAIGALAGFGFGLYRTFFN